MSDVPQSSSPAGAPLGFPDAPADTLRRFVELAPAALAMFDTEMRYLAASQRWRRDYGLEGIPLEGRSHNDVFPDLPEAWKAVHRRCLTGLAEAVEEDPFVRTDGTRQWIRWEVQPWRTPHGDVGGLLVFTEDITRRKDAEAALQQARADDQLLLELSDTLRPLTDPAQIEAAGTRLLGQRLQVDRVGFGTVEGSDIVITADFAIGVPSLVGRYPVEVWGREHVERWRHGGTTVVADVERSSALSAEERAAWHQIGVAAYVVVNVVQAERWVAMFGIQSAIPRQWTDAEIALTRKVADRVWTAVESARVAAALRTNQERQAFLLALMDVLRPLADAAEIQDAAARCLGERLGADRVYYFENDEDRHEGVIHRDFVRGGRASLVGRYPYPRDQRVMDLARGGRTLVMPNRDASEILGPEDHTPFGGLGIEALIIAPLVKHGRLVANLTVAMATPRAWTPFEVGLVEETAERTWAAVERSRAERARRDSDVRFRSFFENAGVGAAQVNPQGRFVAVNDRLCQITGYARDELLTMGPLDLDHPEDVDEDRRRMADFFSAGTAYLNYEKRYVHKAGHSVWVRLTVAPVRDDRGVVLTTAALIEDITDRREMAARSQALETRLQEFLHATADILYSMRVERGTLSLLDFVGPAAEQVYGRPAAAFLANPELPLEVVHPDDQPRVLQAYDALLTAGHFDETYRIVRPDGGVRWLHDRARITQHGPGDVVRIDGIARDITAVKVAEAQLHTAEVLSQSIIESAVDGILVIDEQGTIERANPSARRLFGYEDRELDGQNVRILMPTPYREHHDAYLAHYRTTGEKRIIGVGREVEGRRKDGSTFPLFLSVSEMRLRDGRRFAGIVHDLTALQASQAEVGRSHVTLQARAAQLERQTHQLRRLASEVTLAERQAREQLAKTLHDGLQQLLFSATLKLDRAVQRGVDDALVTRALGEVRDAIAAARALSVELHPPALHAGDLPAALRWLAEWVRERYRLTVRVSADLAADLVDDNVRVLLFESVRELLFNTVKHAQVEQATLALDVRDGHLAITVSDEGVGFDPAAALVAERAQQGGLGLFAIRERVALLGGQLHVDSAPGRGTRFTLEVPLRNHGTRARDAGTIGVPRSAPLPDRHEARPPDRPLRILLVDDHALVREGLRELLTQHPEFDVVGEAAGGHEALALTATLHPDVVLMDVSMPGMDGIEATRRLRAAFPHVRVFGLSTQEITHGHHPIEDAGAAAYFTKTASTHLLLDRLRAERAAVGIGGAT